MPAENRDQGPKGIIETKTASTSMLRAMEEALKTSGQTPWLHATLTEAIEANADRSGFPILWDWDWLPSGTAIRLPLGSRLT